MEIRDRRFIFWTFQDHRDRRGNLTGKKVGNLSERQRAHLLFQATKRLSYRVFYFVLYSLGLRLGEGLRLEVGDIDRQRMRMHVRDSKGNKDRLVPLPETTLDMLHRFWLVHRNPVLLFPNRHGGLKSAHLSTTPLDRGGVQSTLRIVAQECGIKKKLLHTVCVTAMQPI